MLWLLILICILIAALLILLFATFRFVIVYNEKMVTVKMGGKYALFTIYKASIEKKDEKVKEKKDYIKIPTFTGLKNKISTFKRVFDEEKNEIIFILKTLNSSIKVETLDVAVTFGFGDAAVTGIANGFIWSIITAFHGFLLKYINIQKVTNIAVCPEYTKKCFDVDITFIFDTRLFEILGVGLRAYKLFKRNKFQFEK